MCPLVYAPVSMVRVLHQFCIYLRVVGMYMYIGVCTSILLVNATNQSFYRLMAGYGMGVYVSSQSRLMIEGHWPTK